MSTLFDPPTDDALVTAWHVAQVLPDIPSDRLTSLADAVSKE